MCLAVDFFAIDSVPGGSHHAAGHIAADKMDSSIQLTVVFPFVPVMPMTGILRAGCPWSSAATTAMAFLAFSTNNHGNAITRAARVHPR